jgi:hypothetical protein
MCSGYLEKPFNFMELIIVPKEVHRIRGYSVDDYRALARRTVTIDFDCDFKDGVCRMRESGSPGCCHRCADTFGHWQKEDWQIDDDTANKIAGLYDPVNGFCREGTGCILPHELRSPTCLFIYCSDAKMSGKDLDVLYKIRNGQSYAGSR